MRPTFTGTELKLNPSVYKVIRKFQSNVGVTLDLYYNLSDVTNCKTCGRVYSEHVCILLGTFFHPLSEHVMAKPFGVGPIWFNNECWIVNTVISMKFIYTFVFCHVIFASCQWTKHNCLSVCERACVCMSGFVLFWIYTFTRKLTECEFALNWISFPKVRIEDMKLCENVFVQPQEKSVNLNSGIRCNNFSCTF